MSGPFDWGNKGATGDKNPGEKSGKSGELPRHIQRMNHPTEVAEVKKSTSNSDSGLPWGGRPAEQKKAYMSGPPKDKGSMTGGKRTVSPTSLPSDSHKAHAGHPVTIKSSHIGHSKSK